ncbi:50S ribosomal protein L16 [Striga asiatica]|uniref:50S ribosomal protein L16 n=1 Tax=Striga asiatica TaxID=4170 RepID=A0A5A7RDX8_STRAF|nr:50S ribosomal protein L16 [Striga asiatica]
MKVDSHSNERGALGRLRVPHRRQQILPPVHAVRVVAGAARLVRQHVTRVSRVCARPEHPRARRHRLQRRRRRPLEVPAVEGVRHRPGQHCRQVDHHPVHSNVAARRHQRRRLRPVHRLVERPRAETRALARRVPDPRVRESGRRPVRPVPAAPVHAEPGDGNVLRRQDDVDRPAGVPAPGRQVHDVRVLEGLPEGVLLVEDLFPDDDPWRAGGALVLLRRLPPRGNGGGRRCGGVERPEEINDYGALDRGEFPVPDEVEGDSALEEGAVVVLEDQRLLLHEGRHGRGQRKEEEEGDEECGRTHFELEWQNTKGNVNVGASGRVVRCDWLLWDVWPGWKVTRLQINVIGGLGCVARLEGDAVVPVMTWNFAICQIQVEKVAQKISLNTIG